LFDEGGDAGQAEQGCKESGGRVDREWRRYAPGSDFARMKVGFGRDQIARVLNDAPIIIRLLGRTQSFPLHIEQYVEYL
jgi:hypothetical protein